ncbi:hypothetical protein GCM10007108_16890 [Thermogymnomonas acidicola]|uniref:Uncharacterized protein n=1 Tax=Thermogymnomonas acidicola TaxID=399579 RepID=A0AA37BSP1_9ARCH|nr:hypothetical protein [Thermogymnomonas acidicola]GGM79292.1 hypothetical protein GCM10007108_16890 [Thermogymnomonas acidicola]
MGFFRKEITLTTSKSLKELATEFENFLVGQGWKTQSNISDTGAIIQARKGGILRDIVAADRALTFTFQSAGDGMVKVNVGIGKLLQNIAVTAVEVLLLSDLFLFVDVPEMLFTEHVEKELLNQLRAMAV